MRGEQSGEIEDLEWYLGVCDAERKRLTGRILRSAIASVIIKRRLAYGNAS